MTEATPNETPTLRPTFKERGKAKFEARQARAYAKVFARAQRRLAKVHLANWTRLDGFFAAAKEHGEATKERLLDHAAEKFGSHADHAQTALFAVAKWAVHQVNPVDAINTMLNEVEEAEARAKSEVTAGDGGLEIADTEMNNEVTQ